MDAAQIRLVQESLPSIREHRAPASTNFYDNLFALAPQMKGMFRSDITGQGMRFMTTLATIADLLDEPEELSDEIDELAKAHAGLGVSAADFTPMGAALIATLGETLGDEFTPELEAAWKAAYERFAELMIAKGGFT